MEYDWDKIEEAGLAILYLTLHRERIGKTDLEVRWAWKGMDWELLGRLHERGWIEDPVGKEKQLFFSEEGARRCEELFGRMFGKKG